MGARLQSGTASYPGTARTNAEGYRLDELGRPVAWEPQPGPQRWLLSAWAEEILFGGARGGGKTYGILGDWVQHAGENGKHARGIIFRRTYPEFEEVLEQTQRIFPLLGARYKIQRKIWTFPNGATLKLRYLLRDKDASGYQSQQYTWMAFEELGNWASSTPIDALKGCLRSPHGIKVRWVATANPGGVGHNWIKARFITPAPALTPFQDTVTGVWRVFIPSKLEDNPILLKGDPGYVDRLRGVGADWLVAAWLSGDWDVVAGGMFDDLWKTSIHVIAPFEIPKTWKIDRAFDWGSTKPFSVGWWAESDGSEVPPTAAAKAAGLPGTIYKKGSLFRIGEWYGWNGKKPNEGTRMLAVDVARGIRQREQNMKLWIQAGPADPSIFATENGNNIANDMALPPGSIRWEPADAKPGSRKTGWERCRKMLKAATVWPMEEPGLFCFDTCRQFIRTFPTLARDMKDPDDVDSDGEDHIGDETRYRVMHNRGSVTMQKITGF